MFSDVALQFSHIAQHYKLQIVQILVSGKIFLEEC